MTKFNSIPLIIALVITGLSMDTYAQSILGGAGVTLVDDDPDNITDLQTVSQYESNVAFDEENQIVYFYDGAQALGSRWNGVSVSALSSPDTRLDAPRVENGNLVFDVINVATGATVSTESISLSSIAPVQGISGGGDISVSDDGSGTYTISFTESTSQLSLENGVLTFTDENGDETDVTLPTSDGSETKVESGASNVTVNGSGTTADPYKISFNETVTTLTYDSETESITYTNEQNGTSTIKLFKGSVTNEGDGTYTHSDGGSPATTTTIDTRASSNPISDSGDHFNGTNVEDVLQEVGNELNAIQTDISDLESSSHAPAQTVDGASIDFTTSGIDNQTITAEIKGLGDAQEGDVPVVDSEGNISWESAADQARVQGAANGATLNGTNVELEISNLTETAELNDGDEFPVSKSGTDSKVTFDNLVSEITTEIRNESPTVQSLAFNGNGQLIATMTDGSEVEVDMSNIPRVSNSEALEQVASDIGEGKEGMAMAAKSNRLGMPANDDWGVLFFVRGK